ncbi:MAG: dTDP-4-amino-4,6-dideoxygalactose transaminase [Saprospiraceae bacterium]|jgi:dTDP-4-amino-4,6-dideoxygalactose transaminase
MGIPFNSPHVFGEENTHVQDVIANGNIAGNGKYTRECHDFFKSELGFKHCLLTNSCTAALEMAAILLDIKPGDEVIVPSYGYVTTANAFVLRGAKLVFADASKDSPNIDTSLLPSLITDNTKAIVVMHYGGVAINMDFVMELANSRNIFVVEDAAHCIDAYYKNKHLGSIGHLGTISFHSTKNITSGHGGLLIVNDDRFIERSKVIWQKGTDKSRFDEGEQDYYKWVDIGSSFFPSELTAAYLYGQIQHITTVTKARLNLWNHYAVKIAEYGIHGVPYIPEYCTHNGHIFYLKAKSQEERDLIITEFKKLEIGVCSHYLSLCESEYISDAHKLPQSHMWQNCLVRFPMFYDLSVNEIDSIIHLLYKILNLDQ